VNTQASDPDFFQSLKRESERLWETASINRDVYGFQIRPGTKWLPGLAEKAIREFEKRVGCTFPDAYRNFLRSMNGTDQAAINVFGESGEPYT
jgi:SMI1 / KNR4 family (SUKH-1)